MGYHITPEILVMALMAVCATKAAALLDTRPIEEQEAPKNVIAMLLDLNRKAYFHGDSYKEAVFLYKDHTDDTETTKKLSEEVKQLRDEINELRYLKDGDYPQSTTREGLLKRTLDLLAGQLTIKDMVKEYNRTKDWRKLQMDLGQVLDDGSLAHKQLMAVLPTERYPPWQIGYDGHAELAMVLAWAGDGLDMRDGAQDNLLHGAVAGGKVMLVRDLLDSGADIESRNEWGNAPLALACKYRRLGVARLLVARGADIDGINYDEKWAGLARAADNGDLEIVKYMVQAGASTTILDRDGRTPLEVARHKGFTKVVEYLSGFPH